MKNKFKIFLLMAFCFVENVFSKSNPPSPTGKKVPKPPPLPLDDFVLLFMVLALILGLYLVSQYQKSIQEE